MTLGAVHLAPRSAGAIADAELLRVARTDLGEPGSAQARSIPDRLRRLHLHGPAGTGSTREGTPRPDRSRD